MSKLAHGTLTKLATSPEGHALGWRPSTIDLSHLKGQPGPADQQGITLPSSYDLRNYGKVSPVKNQLQCGDCWAFATYGSMESALLTAESWNFSENNLNNLSGFDMGVCSGGNGQMSTAYLARWAGPINASDDPDPTSCSSESTCYNPSPHNLAPKKHVQNVLFIAARANSTDNANLKTAIMTYGGVLSTISADELGGANPYWNASTSAYYYNGAAVCGGAKCGIDHAITLVGWDDNYLASNFTTAPPGNGAFLIKNSWGTAFGSSGFFWISYYDVELAYQESYVFVNEESTTNYTTEYQYDPLGMVAAEGYGTTSAWAANIFTAGANGQLSAVATYTLANNTSYLVEIYTNATNGPTSGSQALTTSGTFSLAGYNTIVLPSSVAITSGQKFSVVVELTTPGYTYPIPIQYAVSGYSGQATASPGQSFISNNGSTWQDFTTVNSTMSLALNAFSKDQQGKTTPTITWSTPAAITYGTPLSATQLNATANVPGSFSYSPPLGTVLNAGTQVLTASFTPTDTTNYNNASGSVTLTVNKATPAITWSTPAPVTVGTALSATQLNATANVPGTFAYNPALGTVMSTAGSTTLSATFTPTSTANYNSVSAAVVLTVNPASKTTPTITWSTPAAITYGAALSATQLNATASVAGTFVYSPAAGTVLTAGSKTLGVTFTPTDTTDYNTATGTVTLTVNKATPIITWSTPAAVVVGTALSATQLNATANAPGTFAYNPALGTVMSTAGSTTLSTTFTPTDTTDYNSASATVTLTVNKVTPTITWSTPAAITYGATLSTTQLNATASVAGTFVYSPAAGTVLTAGSQSLGVTFTPTDTTNYNTATGSVTLTVNKATPIITWSTPVAVVVGTALSATQLNATANTPGTFVYNPAAGTVMSTVGSATLSTTFTPTDTTDYNATSASVTLTVTAVVPSFTVSGTAVTISTPGATTGNTSTITVTPVNGFTGSVALTAAVTSSPSGAQYPPTVSFGSTSPVSITSASAGTATLTISTTASKPVSCTAVNQTPRGIPWYAQGGAVLACVLLFGIAPRRKGRAILGMLLLLVALAGGMLACGGGSSTSACSTAILSGTTAGTYTITLTGTSGSTTATNTVVLTVQ